MSKQSVFASCLVLLSAIAGCAGNGGGTCDPACATSQACCDGMCVFTQIDNNNCGACGAVCAGTCSNGTCIPGNVDGGPGFDSGPQPMGDCHPSCSSSTRCCGTSCVSREQPVGVDGRPSNVDDPTSPFNNCNGCGLRCDPERSISCSIRPGGSTTECACGQFGECALGEVCANSGGSWQCVSLSSDPNNCGEIGHMCGAGERCSGGNCVCGDTGASCGAGQSCCGATCIDTTSDAANCGACGNACGANAPNCQAGTCVCGTGSGARACSPTSGSSLGESCCGGTCLANSATNCGCGVMCDVASDETCIVDMGLFGMGGSGGVCCGTAPPFPGIPGFCSGGFGLGDGGFPFPGGDAGIPFP